MSPSLGLRLALISFSALLPAVAHAHALAPAMLEVRELPGGTAEVRWKLPALQRRGARIEPQLAEGCRPLGPPVAAVEGEGIVQTQRVRCDAASWVGRVIGLEGLAGSDTDAVLHISLADGRTYTKLLSADAPAFEIPSRPSSLEVVREYVVLGIEHLLGGVDHVLFVLGLLALVAGARSLVATLTAFTLGHSVTLSLAVLDVVAVPQAAAELAIAGTILVLGAEVVAARSGAATALSRKPSLMAAAFGLLHGLGFAGALAEIGLPQSQISISLAAFNAGIEIGQLLVVVGALVLARVFRAVFAGALVRMPVLAGYAIGCAAAFWLFERLAPAVRSLGV